MYLRTADGGCSRTLVDYHLQMAVATLCDERSYHVFRPVLRGTMRILKNFGPRMCINDCDTSTSPILRRSASPRRGAAPYRSSKSMRSVRIEVGARASRRRNRYEKPRQLCLRIDVGLAPRFRAQLDIGEAINR